MELDNVRERLLAHSPVSKEYIDEIGVKFVKQIQDGELKINDVVQILDSVLTNGSHEIRLRGVQLLVTVITSLDKKFLIEKEIQVLFEFISLRLIDHKSMEQPALQCLSYFIDCENKPPHYNKSLLEFLQDKANVQKMDSKKRSIVYEISKKIAIERRQIRATMDGGLMYTLIHMMEGESNPENILSCFDLVYYVLKNFDDLEPYIDDIFDWLSSYYPLDFNPDEKDEPENIRITRSQLVESLYKCFYANQLNAADLQTLLLENLNSNVLSTKIESLNCLIRCYEVFPLSAIKDYASSLWTNIRMDCLKKKALVDPNLLETSNKALSALARKLSEDSESYFTFISDLYEELAIAIRKPEMDLFEPACRLITSAIQPKLLGFNFVLSRIVPIAMNAIKADELRPLEGLTHIFEKLALEHPDSKLDSDIYELLEKFVIDISKFLELNEESLKLMRALVRHKIELHPTTLDRIIDILLLNLSETSFDVEECLSLICMNYNRADILFDHIDKRDCQLDSLLQMISFYKLNDKSFGESDNQATLNKFSIYIRHLIIQLDVSTTSTIDSLDKHVLSRFLSEIRRIATMVSDKERLIRNIGWIHAIIINKLDGEHLTTVMMDIFNSDYCLKLLSSDINEKIAICNVYLPTLQAMLKSLVVRNYQLSFPLINLLLNFISSPEVDQTLALHGVRAFGFIQKDEALYQFEREKHYQVFTLFKQKFFLQVSKEIKIRIETQKEERTRYLLISTLAIQVPDIQAAMYRRDFEWLLRELLKILSSLKVKLEEPGKTIDENLLLIFFECIENMIEHDASDNLMGHLGTIVELNLVFARCSKTLVARRQALKCLSNITTSSKEQELLIIRNRVVEKLKLCLEDKKRIVRQAAAEARLRWILVGQPIG